MATVRIYKVAELLNTSSQEVIALLKRDHGIEVKSASSTIEEVVARQYVERLAKQRNIQLPGGDMFAETPPPKGGAKKPAIAKKAPEPPKPVAPALPPPRLVKTAKPAAAPAPVMEADEPPVVEDAPPVVEAPPPPAPEVRRQEPTRTYLRTEPAWAPPPPAPPVERIVEPPPMVQEPPPPPAEPAPPIAAAPAAAVQAPPPPAPPKPATGRVVPPTIRLRIEEQRAE